MRGLCPILKDMTRAVNSAHDDREAMERIKNFDKKAIALRKMKQLEQINKER